ncbi:hypothetical protein [Catenuloplanes atrovinosus]|uniref:Uncharacterized protein n=1 Tax=Catenuloplanes atrovinosus TaxID=137266 RepID=A0AAE3YSP2_9ACTN|nr:hypothetical protein [Catenuloplanes atrovinosus]MDR7278930.1 hypothetical protein [Catenuloplanes atrovinosus]
MPETPSKSTTAAKTTTAPAAAGNTAVPAHGDRDRVAMLSLRADGTPDQHRPEIIGDREFALAATREQFTQQAVSAVDQRERAATDPVAETVEQDPAIAKLQEAHQAAATAAEAAAQATVDALLVGGDAPSKTSK